MAIPKTGYCDRCNRRMDTVDQQAEIERLEIQLRRGVAYAKERVELIREVKRLQAIVDKLPKTADKVVVVPGTNLWYLNHCGEVDEVEVEIRLYGDPLEDVTADKCYSTQQAAQAAGEE